MHREDAQPLRQGQPRCRQRTQQFLQVVVYPFDASSPAIGSGERSKCCYRRHRPAWWPARAPREASHAPPLWLSAFSAANADALSARSRPSRGLSIRRMTQRQRSNYLKGLRGSAAPQVGVGRTRRSGRPLRRDCRSLRFYGSETLQPADRRRLIRAIQRPVVRVRS